MDKHLHIVCFDAPSPPHYGGAIDLYYKIKSLAEAGVKIMLHYFDYKTGRGHEGLESYCVNIYTYKRKPAWQCAASPLPYIVASRINKDLIQRLNSDSHPIILEGIHCTGILKKINNDKRKIVLRLHNNEAAYYSRLAQTEKQPLRNLYYIIESNRLMRYQQGLPKDILCAALSQTDAAYFAQQLHWKDVHFIPAFIPWQAASGLPGAGRYSLYHGNLAISENEAAALWLLKHVFRKSSIPFFIAGKNASNRLQQAISKTENVRLINNPSDDEMELLIKEAQVHVLPSLNETGVKLKLLHALFCGRHCITNNAGIWGSGLAEAVHLAEDAEAMREKIAQLMQIQFDTVQMQQRQMLLQAYNNKKNAEKLIACLY